MLVELDSLKIVLFDGYFKDSSEDSVSSFKVLLYLGLPIIQAGFNSLSQKDCS